MNSLSENTIGADNQQERLMNIGWVIGFVDGEGCFSIGFVKQSGQGKRKGYKTGYQVSHEFVVAQGAKSVFALYDLKRFFGVGQVVINRRYDNHKENMFRYIVRKRQDLQKVIIPFFQQYILRTSKCKDFEKFAKCVDIIERGGHLTVDGLIGIAHITETMNRQKPRSDFIRILRDYTPDTRPPDE